MEENITNLMGDCISTLFVTDSEGNILLANDFTAMSLGIALNELLNSNVYDLVSKKIYNTSATINTLKTGQASVVTLSTQAGYNIQSKATPIFYPDGELHLVVTKSEKVNENGFVDPVHERLNSKEYLSEESYSLKHPVIAKSIMMKKILRLCRQVAVYDSRVLLLGESGVGKEVIANFIHVHSQVSDNKFIAVNCAAIPETLFESEFFGYEKGTFTGADETKVGLIEAADGGTLFLDEISEMPLDLQAKLLRVLETMTFRKVGSVNEQRVSFRLICASNQDMLKLVEEGKFRRDLYYRINSIPVQIPPLRDRKEDILSLANHFLDQFNDMYQMKVQLSNKDISHLMTSEWPGNIRELKNHIEYLVVTSGMSFDLDLCEEEEYLTKDNFLCKLIESETYQNFIQSVEKMYLKDKLDRYGWNISKVSKECVISRPFIYKKIEELKLTK